MSVYGGETGPGVTLQGRVTLSLLQVTVLPLLTVKTQEHQSHLTADPPHCFMRRGPGGRRVVLGEHFPTAQVPPPISQPVLASLLRLPTDNKMGKALLSDDSVPRRGENLRKDKRGLGRAPARATK